MERISEIANVEQGSTPGLLSILMVNWNDRRHLDGSLGSVRNRISVPYEIVLLDNASEDDSIAFVEREYPEVRIVRSASNLGFIRGTNLAAKHARGEFYLMLNPDTILHTDVAPAVHLLQSDNSIGAVGAKMYGGDGTLLAMGASYPSIPRLAVMKSMFWRPFRGACGPKQFGAKRVDWVSGSWLLTRASAWRQVGGLDDRLFMYCDEMHYCRSLREIGLFTALMPSLSYTHFRGFSLKRLPYLYAGYRWFHSKFSGSFRRHFADYVMKAGLQLRVAVFGTLSVLLRDANYADRRRAMRRVLDVWEQTAAPGIRFD